MLTHTSNEMLSVETFLNYIINYQQCISVITIPQTFHNPEIVFVIKYIEIFEYQFAADSTVAKVYHLIKHRQSITQGTIRFMRNDVQCFNIGCYSFTFRYIHQVFGDIIHCDSFKIKYLAPG